MKKALLLFPAILIVISTCNSLFAQKTSTFLGINPSVTVEPFYDKGEFDINVLPVVWQKPVSRRLDIRVNPVLNLGFRNSGSIISHFGAEVAMPVFLAAAEERRTTSKGFFVAPVVSLTRNRPGAHSNTGLWVEPGYFLQASERFGISFGLQLGTTHFNYDELPDEWGGHFGVKVTFGWWL